MPDSANNAGDSFAEALAVYEAFVRQRGGDSAKDFNALCREHPQLAGALKNLHSGFQLAEAAATSRSLHQSVRDLFGEEAEVKLTLDEADAASEDDQATVVASFGVPPSGGPGGEPVEAGTPSRADRYALEGEVARGGMGIIYKVRDRELNRTLAMKVMLGGPSLTRKPADQAGRAGVPNKLGRTPERENVERAAAASPSPGGEGRGEGERQHPLFARFLEEVQVTAQLDHPGIVAVHELGLDAAGRPYFTMKLVKGRELGRIFDLARAGEGWDTLAANEAGRVPPRAPPLERSNSGAHGVTRPTHQSSQSEQESWNLPRAIGALIKACQAVAFAHTKGVIHRDLKPANVMVGRFGEVYVMDWGLAKVTGRKDLHDLRLAPASRTSVTEIKTPRVTSGSSTADSPLITMDGSVVGTPAYMPPEQARGQVEQVDLQSDIYSLGAILYNLLTGQAPYVERGARISPHTILGMVIQGAPKRIHTLNSKAPPELVAICEKAMAREKRDRYSSSLDLAEDLQAYLDNRVVKAYRTGAVAEFKLWVARNKALGSVTAAAVLLAFAGLVAFISQQKQANYQLRRNLYVADMKVASVALNEHNRGFATALVTNYLHQTGANDLRGWEWRYLWKLCQGKEQFTLPGQSNRVVALAFSPDSKTLFSGGGGDVKIWDLASQRELATLRIDTAHTNAVASSPTNQNLFIGWRDPAFITDLAISTNGQTLVIGSFGGGVVRYGPSFASETERPLPGAKFPLALSADGQTLVTGGMGTNVIIWDTANWKPLHTLGQSNLSRVAFSPDRATVAMLIKNRGTNEVMLWKVDSLRADGAKAQPASVLQRGTNEFGFLDAIAFSKDAQILATAGNYRGIQLWDTKTGLPLSKPESSIEFSGGGIVFLPDGKTLLTHNGGQDFRVRDISSRTNIVSVSSIPGHLNEIWSLVLAPNGQRLASGSKDGTIKLWSTDVFQEQPGVKDQLDGHRIEQVVFSQDGGTMFTISSNSSFGTWETATLQPLTSYELPRDVGIAVISPQGNQVAAGLTNGAVQIWSVPSREKAPQLRRELLPAPPSVSKRPFAARGSAAFPLVTWSADGKRLAAYVGELHVWEAVTDQLVRKLSLGDKPYSIALSPNGRILAAGINQNIELWDLTTGKKLSTCVGHTEYTLELTFSPDGKTLASADIDNTAALWEVPSGKRKFPLTSHTSAVIHLAFSPDGRTLATRSADSVVKLWNVETGRELLTIELPPDSNDWKFGGVRFSPDGSLLAVGILAPEPHLKFYRAPALTEIDALEAAKARNR